MIHPIDIHVLTMRKYDGYGKRENLEYIQDILASEPVNLHIVDVESIGHESHSRIQGISHGNANWVGWVDPDDEIIPGTYQKLLDVVGDKKFAWSNELVKVFNSKGDVATTRITTIPHHMMIMHRDVLDPNIFLQRKFAASVCIQYLIKEGVHLNEIGYIWNQYNDSDCQVAQMIYN
jgi:hypothetical protein